MDFLLNNLKQKIQHIDQAQKFIIRDEDRRFVESFVKTFKLSQDFVEPILKFLSHKKPTNLVWLSLSECTGCTESFLRNEIPGIDSLLLEYINLDYHEVLMSAAGFQARENLKNLKKGEYFLIVEGSVCAQQEYFATFGAEASSGAEELLHLSRDAFMVLCVGTCSSFGGVQAANPNPTNTESIDKLIQREVVNIPGCPPSDINIIYTLMYAIIFEEAPSLDALNRPLWAYGKTVHDTCERKAKFESGDFVQTFGDEKMTQGYCLYKVGCKGPYAYNNCPKVKFNSKTSWPIQAGHGCIACSEPNFWDDFGVFETPMTKQNKSFAKEEKKEAVSMQDFHTFVLNLQSHQIGIFLDSKQTQILFNGKNILSFNLELNTHLFLEGLAKKSKLTSRLVENYQTYFPKLYQKNMHNMSDSRISQNPADTLLLMHEILSLEKKENIHYFALQEAMSFPFKVVSDMDFSVKVSEDNIVIDAIKGMRLILCYALGGLEYDGIAYGILATLCKALKEGVAKFIVLKGIKNDVVLGGDLVQNSLIEKWLLK